MGARVYLDHNATTPLRPEARAAMIAAMDLAGNPSSVHAEGRAARALVERARGEIAAALGCKPAELVFTSGATEAAAILSRIPGGATVEPTAHSAVWAHHTGGDGVLATGLANGESGVVDALPARDGDAWRWGGLTGRLAFLDITQAVGRIPFAFGWAGVDMAALAAHKFGGPKGIGALIIRDNLDLPPLMAGGGQEMGRRSGTENIAAIAGFAAAAIAAQADLANGAWERVAGLRNLMEEAIASAAPDTISVGKDRDRLPNTALFITPGWKGETQVMAMDLAGFAVSAGSACSSGKVKTSRILQAMGFDDLAAGSALRVSLGLGTQEEDILRFVEAWSAKRKTARLKAA